MRHELKITPEHYATIMRGEKTCEILLNDQDYRVGDFISLQPVYEDGKFCDLAVRCRVSHVLSDSAYLAEGYVALSLHTECFELIFEDKAQR